MTTPGQCGDAGEGWRGVISRLVARHGAPAVIATDLDGTLLGPDGRVSSYTRAVLAALLAAGGEFVIVTARPPRWLSGVASMVAPGGQILASNGAYVVDAATGAIVTERVFPREVVADLIGSLRAAFPGLAFAAETREGLTHEAAFPADLDVAPGTVVPDLAAWCRTAPAVGKLLGRTPHIGHDEVYDVMAPVVGERAHLAYSGAAGLLELTAPGVTKAHALAEWCAARGHGAADVWAFGDMPNDLPMLRWAGAAFAPAGAHPDVLAVADAAVPAAADDGVARAVAVAYGLRVDGT